MNNLNRVQNIVISDGTALPTNNSAITAMTVGQVAVFGSDWTALDHGATDTISTQNSIYLVEAKTDSGGTTYYKKTNKIKGTSVISYNAESYAPSKREVWSIGYNRSTATGLIEVNPDTDYNFIIRFKNDKWLYSQRPEVLNAHFQSAVSATQLTNATAIASIINNSAYKKEVVAIVVGDGTGVYGVTNASNYGVEITSKDVDQFSTTTYTPNKVYFSVHVNDASGFGTTTTCSQIQAFTYGSGTYDEIYMTENKDFGYEGVTNRRLWPIHALDYSTVSTYNLSSAIVETVAGTSGEDKVTFSATVAAKIRAGEKVELGGVNYEIKYFISTTVAILTSVLTGTLTTGAVKVRYKYDTINIEFNDSINTPGAGVVAVANKSIIIAVPAITTGNAYTTLSAAGTDLKAILDAWMATTPGAFPAISI